ncbi:hypothetical protein CBL_07111 [Carabus blaptoides fortunei]
MPSKLPQKMLRRSNFKYNVGLSFWLFKIAYLGDVFTKLNDVDRALQGHQTNVFTAGEKILTFKRKVQFWISCVNRRDLECFPATKDILEEESIDLDTKLCIQKFTVRNSIRHKLVQQYADQKSNVKSSVAQLFTLFAFRQENGISNKSAINVTISLEKVDAIMCVDLIGVALAPKENKRMR